jgi:small ligand-binding sensory domain FIST
MQCLSFISDHHDHLYAADCLIDDVACALSGRPDALFLFFSASHAQHAAALAERFHEQLEPRALLGCSAEGVIGGAREIEHAPAISVLAAFLPDVRLHPFFVATDDWPELMQNPDSLRQLLSPLENSRAVIVFADPYTTPLLPLLGSVNQNLPGLPIIGGLASGAEGAGKACLVLRDGVFTEGLVGLTLAGPLSVDTVVSQGCRPVGRSFLITKAHEHVIHTLGGRPALQVIQEVLSQLAPADQALLENGLFVGRVIDEYKEEFGRGDFLVRNLACVSKADGAIAITDIVRVGQTIQFHIRDAKTADEDMADLFRPQRNHPPAGVLLFSCNGRGRRMFSQPDHDIGLCHEILPATPVAGFFAAGEIGPVGGKNFLHSHTASLALLRPTPRD